MKPEISVLTKQAREVYTANERCCRWTVGLLSLSYVEVTACLEAGRLLLLTDPYNEANNANDYQRILKQLRK